MGLSLIQQAIARVGPAAFKSWWDTLPAAEREMAARDWSLNARPEQLPPGSPGASSDRTNWRTWLLNAGRGFGKTRTGAETVTELVCSGRARSIALIAPTLKKARQLMIEKPRSGLLAVSRPDNMPRWYPGKNEIHWPNGARGYVFTSEKPDDLRGFEGDLAWCEEMGSWKYPGETWSNLQFGLRVPGPKGDQPRAIVTTTPRPIKALRDLIANPSTVTTGGSTYENAVNLDASALEDIKRQYEGTRLGRQELHAEILSDTPGALWTLALIDANRVRHAPPLKRVVIAIDPATKDPTAKRDSDEDYRGSLTGIVAAGIGPCRCRGKVEDHGFVLEDGSGIYTPREWAEKAVELMNRWGGDRVIGEVNNGGALVESNLRAYGDERIPYRAVTASRGKQTRAEPISALDEQARIHHVGVHPELEDEMTTWQPLISRKSPDRMDARVWALTELMLKSSSPPSFPSGSILPRRW